MSRASLWGMVFFLICALVGPSQVRVAAEEGAQERLDLSAQAPLDKGLAIRGVLPSGMRYWVHPNAKPRGAVSLVLHIEAGSVHERKTERGYAHLLEHLAFEGGKHFEPGTVVPYFASQGITFGLHQNAHTSYSHTEYSIHFPSYAEGSFQRGLQFLSDVARDLSLLPEEVEKEKPVVVEESRTGDDLRGRVWDAEAKLALAGSRYALRPPIGNMDDVRAATSKTLHAFHHRLYRPDRVTLIVVGDVQARAAETAIQGVFGDWKKPTKAAAKLRMGPLVRTGLRISVVPDKDQQYVQVRITHNRPAQPDTTYQDLRHALIHHLARQMFSARLKYMQRMKNPILAYSWVRRRTFIPGLEMTVCGGAGRARAWIACLRELVHEIRRVHKYGFELREFQRAKNAVLNAYESVEPLTSSEIATAHQRTLARGGRPIARETRERLARHCLPGITVQDVDGAFRSLFALKDCSVLLSLPVKDDRFTPPKEEEVREYFEEALQDKLKSWSERMGAEVVAQVLAEDPEPGKIVSKAVDETHGVTALVLENGVRANLHALPGTGKVHVRVCLLGGRLEEDKSNRGITSVAFGSFGYDGLAARGVDASTLLRYVATRQMGLSCYAGTDCITYDLWATRKDLDDAMRLLWLVLSAPRVDAQALKYAQEGLYSRVWNVRTDVAGMAEYWLEWYQSGADPRWELPEWEVFAEVTEESALAWVKRILQSAPMEVAIVGDLKAPEAEALAQRWFGSLPKRPERWATLDEVRRVKGQTGPVRFDEKVESGEAGAVVLLAWRGISRSEDAAQSALNHAANIIDARLFKILREQHGLSYDVGATYVDAELEGMGRLVVRLTTGPATAEQAAEIAKKVVLDLVKNGPTEKELETVSKQYSALIELGKALPSSWMGALTHLWLDGRTLEGAAIRLAGWQKADGALLRKTLQRVVQDDRLIQIIALPTPPKKSDKDDKDAEEEKARQEKLKREKEGK